MPRILSATRNSHYDREILRGDLAQYEWLHLHHEDFTGQFGKFYGAYRHATWYMEDKKRAEEEAAALGFSKVSELKRAVTDRNRLWVPFTDPKEDVSSGSERARVYGISRSPCIRVVVNLDMR